MGAVWASFFALCAKKTNLQFRRVFCDSRLGEAPRLTAVSLSPLSLVASLVEMCPMKAWRICIQAHRLRSHVKTFRSRSTNGKYESGHVHVLAFLPPSPSRLPPPPSVFPKFEMSISVGGHWTGIRFYDSSLHFVACSIHDMERVYMPWYISFVS